MANKRNSPAYSASSRLSQPSDRRRSLKLSVDQEQAGKMSEGIARFLGSWRFIGYMTAFIFAWIAWNVWGPADFRFDEWQFIGLTLLLSLQASYAAPLILLAANRQADRDRVQYAEDRARNDRIMADVEYLTREVAALRIALGDVATRDYLRSELRDISENLERLTADLNGEPGNPEDEPES